MNLSPYELSLIASLEKPLIVAGDESAKACQRLRQAKLLHRVADYVLTDDAGRSYIRSSYVASKAGRELVKGGHHA